MRIVAIVAIVVVAALAWSIVNRLSADAIGMALGLGFGVLAGIPAALLVFVASRRRPPYDYDDDSEPSRFSTLPLAPPSTGNSFRMIESTSRRAPLARGEPVYDYSGDTTAIQWPEPVFCVLLWPGHPVSLHWSRFTTPLDEALSSGGTCYVLESEWSRYAMQRGSYS